MNTEPEDQAAREGHHSADPGEQMNVRRVHAAIWREEAEPMEVVRRTPEWLKHFYIIMFLWLLYYLVSGYMGGWRWKEYEPNPEERVLRENAREAAKTARR